MMQIMRVMNSLPDMFGNCYWAFSFEKEDGKTVEATISGGASNIESAAMILGGGSWEEMRKTIMVVREEMKIREFNRMIRGWSYAGCLAKDIAEFIRKELQNG